jgi:molybdopterin-biosynthesis enzyme MoeA-like protein
MNEARLKMANVPVGATLIPNPVSSAPGFKLGNVHVMAGVPRICQAMIDAVMPELRGGATVLSTSITTNLAEGTIADGLTAIQNRHVDVEIGSYPMFKQGVLSTTLVLRSPDATRNKYVHDEVAALIAECGGQLIEPPAKD